MELVIDANILFAGLIRDSTTATLLFNPNLRLYCPEFILEEFMKYSGLITQKMKRTEGEFVTILHQLHQIIAVVPQEEYEPYMEEAKSISPDEKDVMYLALALKLRCGVWSNDSKLKEQNKVMVFNTRELLSLLEE